MKNRMGKRVVSLAMAMLICLTAVVNVIAIDNDTSRTSRNFANVVIFAYFQDETNKEYYNESSKVDPSMTAAENILEFYDGAYGRSFKNYMSTISDGQFIIQNVFPQWDDASKTVDILELPFKKSDAESGNIDYSIVKYVAENSSLPEDAVVDYDNDGLIDNLTIILQGGTTYDYASTMPSLYPHQSSYPGASFLGGKRISAYNMLNTERLLDSSLADQSGLICHEFLHTLGYPDLYTRDGSLPVYSWDIMGQSSKYLTRPLAYLRMVFSGWVDLPTLTESQASVSLKVNEAVIIKSPLNPYEVFVVERREKTSALDSNSIDAVIGGSGLIVYRVDTTVEGLSNYFGKTGVYIFRPQAGQNGYVEGNERLTLSNAFLSQEANRTSIGSDDPAGQLTDGALTFSDGSNSGIKIADVSSAQGESMTFSVTIPDASQYDLWEDTNFPNHTYTALANIGGKQMAAGYDGRARELQLYQYENGTWTAQGPVLSDKDGINNDVKLLAVNGKPVVAYTDGNGALKLQKYTADGWSAVGSPIANVNSFDVQESTNGQSAHLCYIANNYSSAYYASVTETAVSSSIQYANGFLGNAKVVVTDDTVYAAARNVSDNAVLIYPLNEAGTGFDAAIASPGNAPAYDLMAYNNVLYFAMGTTSQLQLKKYNGSAWEEYAQLAIDSFTPKLAVAQGNLYVLTVPAGQSATDGLRVYSVANGQLQSEGEIVDRNGSNYFLMASQDNLFVGYTVDYNKAMVKKKTTANPLVSLTITPPDKTTYLKGDPVSTVGLKVMANYANSQRELEPTEYTISGFDTATAGERMATISFGGKENTFAYTVLEETEPQPTVIDKVTVNGLEAPEAGKTPDTNAAVTETGAAIQDIIWEGKLTNGKFTYNQAYTAKITLKAEDGYVFASSMTATLNGKNVQAVVNADGTLTLTQTYLPLEAPGIIAKPANLELEVGEKAVITVDDPTGSTLTWVSGDDTIATVDQKGNVTAVAEGSTQITVTNEYGKSAVVKVTVTKTEEPQPTVIDKVNVNGLEAPEAGKTPDTNAVVAETGAAIQSITWEGKLANGKFTYNQAYTAKITLKAQDGYVFASSVTATLNGKAVQAVVNADGTLTLTQTYLPLEAPGIIAKPANLELEVGEKAVITVDDPTGSALTWESADDTIATVNQNGNVTAVAEGSTQITVTNEYGKSAVVKVTVTKTEEPQPTVIDKVTVSGLEAPEAGKTPDTNAAVAGTGAAIQSITWEGKLTNGKFTYNQAYTAKITLKAENGYIFANNVTTTLNGKTVQAVVNADGTLTLTQTYLPLEAPGIIAKPANLELEVGEKAVITVDDPTGSTLTWVSGDDTIATMDQNGNVTAVAEGSTQITVTNEYGKSAVVKVTVTKKAEPQPTVIDEVNVSGLEAPEAGKTPDANAAVAGTGAAIQDIIWEGKLTNGKFTYNQAYTAKITFKAEDGYVFANSVTATLNGKAVQAVVNADGTLTLTQTYLPLEAPGIIAKPANLELEVGEKAVITVDDPTGSALTWESADDTIAIVDQKGNVTAVAEGTTQITVTNEYGKSAVVKVTVTKKAEPQPTVIDKVIVNGLEAPEAGKTPDTNATVAGTGAAIQSITWEGKLANGKFTYNQAYTAKITLKAEDGYVFANSVTATLNGKTVQAVVNADGTLTLTQTYLPLEAPGIIAKPANLELEVGESAVITVDDPTGSILTWESADDTVAIVDQKGNVTAVAEGTTQITVTNEYGKSAVVKVTVTKKAEPQPTVIDKVTVSGLEAPEAGKTPDTNAAVAGTGAAIQSITWEGKLVNGKFTYNQAYTAKITLKAEDGYVFANSVTATLNGKTVQAVVNADGTLTLTQTYLPLEAPGIIAKPANLELEVGESAVITVDDPTGSTLTWESRDSDIASVDQNGNVTAVAEGSTQITVTNEYGKSAVVKVTVTKKAEPQPTVIDKVIVNGLEAPEAGKTPDTNAAVAETGAAIQNVTWQGKLANGKFTYNQAYTAKITFKAEDGYVFANSVTATLNGKAVQAVVNADGTLTLTQTYLPLEAPGIIAKPANLELEVGEKAVITVDDPTGSTLTWVSGDDTIATVDQKGNVTAVAEGTTQITVTNEYGSYSIISVTVKANEDIGGGEDSDSSDNSDSSDTSDSSESSESDSSTSSDTDSSVGEEQSGTSSGTDENTSHSSQPVETGAKGGTPWAPIMLTITSGIIIVIAAWKKKKYYSA